MRLLREVAKSAKLGISDLYATIILMAAFLLMAAMFLIYIQSIYSQPAELLRTRQLVAAERSNVIVRLVDYTEDYVTILVRRLDGYNRVALSMVGEQSSVNCSTMISYVSGGRITSVRDYRLENVMAFINDNFYDFRYYVSLKGYNFTEKVAICVIELQDNALITMRLSNPVSQGYNATQVYAVNRDWLLRGTVEFMLASDSTIFINGTRYYVPANTALRIGLNARTGVIAMDANRVQDINVDYTSLYVNETLLSTSGNIRVTNVTTRLNSTNVGLSLKISPRTIDSGSVRVIHGDRVVYQGSDPVYIDVVGLSPGQNIPLSLRMDTSSLNLTSGLSYAIFISNKETRGLTSVSVFLVVFVEDKAFIASEYRYSYSDTGSL